MAHPRILTAVALACLAAACGNSSTNEPPKTATDQTTTTSAPQSDSPSLTMAGPGAPVGGYPSTPADTGLTTGTGTPGNTTAGTTPGSSPTMGSPGDSTPTAAGDTQSPSLSDGDIVAVVQAADRGEIDQAHEAVRKAKSARVKEFAQHMVTDHSAAEAKIASLDNKAGISPRENAVTAQLKSGGDQIMSNLKSSSGTDFDKTYIDAQVNQHTQVLDLLDNKLIPHAQNSDLAKALQEIRTKVASHLRHAQDIQTSLSQAK